jgi:hypothetical protein
MILALEAPSKFHFVAIVRRQRSSLELSQASQSVWKFTLALHA